MSQLLLAAFALIVYATITRTGVAARVLGVVSAAAFGALAGTTVVATGLPTTLVVTVGAVGFYVLAASVISRRNAER